MDVNLYAYSNGAKDAHLKLAGNKENTDIGDFIAKYLALDLPALTKKIISSGSGVSGGGGGGGATIASSNEALNHFHSDRMKENKQPSSQ